MNGHEESGYHPYPAYKASGVEWLGEVPAHWEVKRLKTIAAINSEALGENTSPDLSLDYIDISNVDSVQGVLEKQHYVFETAPSRARRIVRHGDVIVSTVRTYLRAIAEIENPEPNLVVSTGFAVIRPHTSLYSRFARYSLRAPYFVERVVAESVGVSYPAINASEIACIGIALPPLPEQHAIAAFLDHKTAEIDTLIAAKERLIALLREKRAALITSAVTKGLDPDVAMKDSGVEWLGEVPEHWEVRSLRRILTRRRIKNGSAERPMLSLSAYRGIVFKEYDDEALVRPTEENSDYVVVKPGQLVVNPMWVINSSIGVSTISGIVSPAYRVYDVSSDVFGLFLHNLTKSLPYISQYNRYIRGLTTYDRSVREDDFLNIEALIPPLPEQHAITAFLDRQTAGIDALVGKVEDAIDRLKEYRTALISAAVTGKIDVRNL